MSKKESKSKNKVKEQKKSQGNKKIIIYVVLLPFFLILTVISFFMGFEYAGESKFNYQETSDIDYRVYLKDNNYYETDYLDKNMQYIANLIDTLNVVFQYNIKSDSKFTINFQYYITGDVTVYDSIDTNKILFNKTYPLTEIKNKKIEKESDATLYEKVEIDYDNYNDLIKSFKQDYNLLSTSNLDLVLHIVGTGKSLDYEVPFHIEDSIRMSIPLTEQTINITLNYQKINEKDFVVREKSLAIKNIAFAILSFVSLMISIIVLFLLIYTWLKLRKNKSQYELTLRKILKEYDRLIGESKDLNLSSYKNIIEVTTFLELVDIRDNLQLPILFIEKEKDKVAYFIVKNKEEIYRFTLKNEDKHEKK